MNFIKSIFDLSLAINNLWLFSAVFLLLNMGFLILFPKYNIGKFVEAPKVKYCTMLNQITYYLLFFVSVFVPLKTGSTIFYIGLFVFISGLLLYAGSLFYFAVSEYHLPVTGGIYKFSRHPVYLSFLIITIGMITVSMSLIVFIIAFLHFYSLAFIIKEEEMFCEKKYGNLYTDYKKKTRKYL